MIISIELIEKLLIKKSHFLRFLTFFEHFSMDLANLCNRVAKKVVLIPDVSFHLKSILIVWFCFEIHVRRDLFQFGKEFSTKHFDGLALL